MQTNNNNNKNFKKQNRKTRRGKRGNGKIGDLIKRIEAEFHTQSLLAQPKSNKQPENRSKYQPRPQVYQNKVMNPMQ